ncbi:MAG: rRNA (cytidine1402-2-O)-methyltransferase [Actinomycetota bacterium]|nr:rRNA (cytidine1402-2-O)-methyltransferase [Actinomycetota bacterium]
MTGAKPTKPRTSEAGGSGALVLVATPIGNLGDLSPRAVAELRAADVIAAEDTRRTRKLLSHAAIPAAGRLRAVHAHNEQSEATRIVDLVRGGARVVYVSDAGTPGVSDPGERLVQACIQEGLTVEAVPGPSAVLAALVVSGLPTTPFVFEGFLARKGSARSQRIAAMLASPATTVILESPVRLGATLAELRDVLGDARRAVVARELTKLHEEVLRGTLGELADAIAARPRRGECVIVVGPVVPDEPKAVDDSEIRSALERALASGASRRDAAAGVAAELGVAKRRTYELAVALPSSEPFAPPFRAP